MSEGAQYLLWTALHEGNTEGVRHALKEKNADPSLAYLNQTPLHAAASMGRLEIMGILIDAGADANFAIPTRPDGTALLGAVTADRLDSVRFLLDHGANPSLTPEGGSPPLLYAVASNQIEIAEALLKAGAAVEAISSHGLTPLMRAAENGFNTMIEMLVSCGANLEASGKVYGTALSMAASKGHSDSVETLVRLGASLETRNSDGATPLHSAAVWWQMPTCTFLLNAGANPQAANNNLDTPLMIAAREGIDIKALLEYDVGIELRNKDGRTALLCAAEAGNVGAVRDLLEAGADHTVQDLMGRTPAFLAQENGHHAVVALLEYLQLSGCAKPSSSSLARRNRL